VSARAIVDDNARPRLAPHRQLRFDKVRGSWNIQAPERAFLLDDIAHAIVSRCDGKKTVAELVDELCLSFGEAPRETIAADVVKLVQDFADKGVMVL
jgi:pyrroloquinoline quinone biosynthesis protein D